MEKNNIYRKIIYVEAIQWFNDVVHDSIIPNIIDRHSHVCRKCYMSMNLHGRTIDRKEDVIVCPGNWVVRDINDNLYFFKDNEFKKNYEKV